MYSLHFADAKFVRKTKTQNPKPTGVYMNINSEVFKKDFKDSIRSSWREIVRKRNKNTENIISLSVLLSILNTLSKDIEAEIIKEIKNNEHSK